MIEQKNFYVNIAKKTKMNKKTRSVGFHSGLNRNEKLLFIYDQSELFDPSNVRKINTTFHD